MGNNTPELKSKWPRRLWRFFVRFLTYQFVLFWIYIKYYGFSKYGISLKSKAYEALAIIGTKSALVDEIFTYPELTIRLITYLEAFLVVFALFGTTKYGTYLSIITGSTAFLYNNPFLKSNLEQYWLGMSPDFLLSMGVSLSLMVSALRPHCCDATEDWNPWEFENEDDDDDENEKDLSVALNMPQKKVTQAGGKNKKR